MDEKMNQASMWEKMWSTHSGKSSMELPSPSSSPAPSPGSIKAQIEIIPCKVCGDKSSGVHYGVITCEGCKGFFRRSQSSVVNYQCPRTKNCVVDRVNRNRCQYCRLQKCLRLGMSRDAVKFGRMSKKQREKVEDEVRYHRAQMKVAPGSVEAAPDSSGFDHSIPSSSDQNLPYNPHPTPYHQYSEYTPNGYAFGGSTGGGLSYEIGGDFVDSTTSSGTGFEPRSNSTELPDSQNMSLMSPSGLPSTCTPADSVQISDLLAKTISDAHLRTCLYSTDQVNEMLRRPSDPSKMLFYKDHEELWVQASVKLTGVVQQIIEFAKMVPGFMKLPQDDQIVLLKAGAFELVVLRVTRHYDMASNTVLFGDTMLHPEAFMTPETTTTEKDLVTTLFTVVRTLAGLKLTESQLALFSAFVLLSPGSQTRNNTIGFSDTSSFLKNTELFGVTDRPGLKGLGEITRLQGAVLRALRYESAKTHRPIKGDVTVVEALLGTMPQLRECGLLHLEALTRFKRISPHTDFPALHKELFAVDPQ